MAQKKLENYTRRSATTLLMKTLHCGICNETETYNAGDDVKMTCARCVIAICENDEIKELTLAAEAAAKQRMKNKRR